LANAPAIPPGFSDSVVLDVVESSARFGLDWWQKASTWPLELLLRAAQQVQQAEPFLEQPQRRAVQQEQRRQLPVLVLLPHQQEYRP
jgi:hypothetical protein